MPPPPTSVLQADLVMDVAVVGAGYTGLSAALHLAEGGASVAVLESEDIGYGASGRNVGLVNAGMWVLPSGLRSELGEVYGPRLLHLLGNGPSLVFQIIQRYGIECEAIRNGTLHCAVGASGWSEITERVRQWARLGAPVSLLSAGETAAKVGTQYYAGSLLDLRAGTIQPLSYVRGLARAAQSAGARLFSGSPVVAVEDTGSQWILTTDAGKTVTAKWVIVATNGYTAAKGVWSGIGDELVRLPYFNVATPPLSGKALSTILPERHGAWDTRKILSSFRLDSAGRLVFGSVGALRGSGRDIHPRWGRRALAKLFPELNGIDFEHEWYGFIDLTANSLPRFHSIARNVVSFSGYNGRGIAPGTVFGRQLAQLVLGVIGMDELPLPVTEVQRADFKAVKEGYYEFGAQIAHLVGARFP